MTCPTMPLARPTAFDFSLAVARWIVGGVFVYMGLTKALHPVEFLKLVRQYEVFEWHVGLNLAASALPWFEVFCGALLIAGVAVRGVAVLLVAMLIPFTALVLRRALAMHESGGLPFCSIKFDCGCGSGEVLICRKLAENALLTALSAGLCLRRHHRLCPRPALFGGSHDG